MGLEHQTQEAPQSRSWETPTRWEGDKSVLLGLVRHHCSHNNICLANFPHNEGVSTRK